MSDPRIEFEDGALRLTYNYVDGALQGRLWLHGAGEAPVLAGLVHIDRALASALLGAVSARHFIELCCEGQVR